VALINKADTCDQHLVLLWVHPDHRGHGLGSELLERVLRKFDIYHVSLKCHKKHRDFYERHGFAIEECIDDLRRMTTNREYLGVGQWLNR